MRFEDELFNKWFLTRVDHREHKLRLIQLFKQFGLEVIYVGDLVKCREASILELNVGMEIFTEIAKKRFLRNFFNDVLHASIDKFLTSYYKSSTYRVKIIDKYVIFGKPDLYTGNGYPVEIKFCFSNITKPLRSWKIQTQLYAWLCNKEKGKLIIIRQGKVIHEKWYKSMSDEEVIKWVKEWETKIPLWSNECGKCDFNEICELKKM